MMANAMEQTGSVTDLKAIAEKVKSMRYDGVRTMRFDKDGRAQSDIDIGMLKDGKISSVRAPFQ
jgi:branched-chain amino acid transport system substrate-binding protein